MYEIEFTPEAVEDLKALRKFEQEEVVDGIESQLRHEPTVETRNRKKLRPNENGNGFGAV
jgi:mRNA-degrading endonuclease RelE of RelBE toxin-antitoxin system